MPLKNWREDFDDGSCSEADCLSWLEWMLVHGETRHATAAMPAVCPVADLAAWARVMCHPETRRVFAALDLVPVERGRVVDPSDSGRVIVHWQVIEQPKPYWQSEAA
jgi:hypothetical protein